MTWTRLKRLLNALPLLGACHPILAPTPMQLGETAPALEQGEIAVTAQGGAASAGWDGGGAAGGPRGRFWLGGQQGLGIGGPPGHADATGGKKSGDCGGGQHTRT